MSKLPRLTHVFTPFSFLLATLFISACGGGGGGGSTSSTPTNQGSAQRDPITIDTLLSFSVNEGEPVTLDLNARGDNLSDISYVWEVDFQDGTLPFEGQGTDSIS